MKKLLASIIVITVIMGCGYRFRATGEPVGINYRSLAIPLMTSTSSDKGFEADFTRIIRQEFISNATVPFMSEDKAQAVLRGKIHDIKTEPLAYDIQQLRVQGHLTTHKVTRSRRLKIKLAVKLTDRDSGAVLWRDAAMVEEASFIINEDPLETRYNQQLAVEEIARRMAKRIYLKTMDRF